MTNSHRLVQDATPLSISEALVIMERSKLDFTAEKRVPSEAFSQMWQHVERFAPYQSQAAAKER